MKRRKRKTDRERADELVKAIYHARGRCERCGKPGTNDWAHTLQRNYYGVRYFAVELGDPIDGAKNMCKACHTWWHKRPVEAELWYEERFPGERAELMRIAVEHIREHRKTDYEALFQKAKEAGYAG